MLLPLSLHEMQYNIEPTAFLSNNLYRYWLHRICRQLHPFWNPETAESDFESQTDLRNCQNPQTQPVRALPLLLLHTELLFFLCSPFAQYSLRDSQSHNDCPRFLTPVLFLLFSPQNDRWNNHLLRLLLIYP